MSYVLGMTKELETYSEQELRPASQIMRLSRLGSLHQSRLSFMRILLRRLKNEGWTLSRLAFDLDASGVGRAVYTLTGPVRSYSLVAFSHDLPDELRSDRVIAEAWDSTFTLFDGVPKDEDVQRLEDNVPFQEAGRISETELTLSRANQSGRLFNYVVESLAKGEQPSVKELSEVGYLMRTTAVYGSGKFGALDRQHIKDRPEFAAPFQAEMLTVYLIRTFVVDRVNHIAKMWGGNKAVSLSDENARVLGIGNSTGLGMAPFLINHPLLLNNWIAAREAAILRVRSQEFIDDASWYTIVGLIQKFSKGLKFWNSKHPYQVEKIRALKSDLEKIADRFETVSVNERYLLDGLLAWSEKELGLEGQELLASVFLEPFGDLVDELANGMSADEEAHWPIEGMKTIGATLASIKENYAWALEKDWENPSETARVWYVSAEKLEPRLGERASEPIEPFEQPLAPAREIAKLCQVLESEPDQDGAIAKVLMRRPEFRSAVRRVQLIDRFPYSEIRENTICSTLMPVEMLRCKLSFFGAAQFDPRSDRWVRINMFQNAPYPDQLSTSDPDDWPYDCNFS